MAPEKKKSLPKRRAADLHPELAESGPRKVRKDRTPAPQERSVRPPTYLEQIRAKIVARGKQKYLGFTLTELIVTVSIIATLGTISSVSVMGVFGSARDAVRVTDLTNISTGLGLHYTLNNTYPKPSNATLVTYSGASAWLQGTFGESAMREVEWNGVVQISAKPIDPLLKTEYAYSLTSESREYSLMANYEGDNLSYHNSIVPTTYAASWEPTLAYVKGTYNGVVTRVSTGGVVNFLAVPNIVTVTGVTIVDTTDPLGFMLHGQSNSGVLFTPKVAYASSTFPNNTDTRIAFASGIVAAYSDSSLGANQNIQPFVSAANDPAALASLGEDLLSAITGGDTNTAAVVTPTPPAPVAPVVPAYNSATSYASGQTFAYSDITVTVSGTGMGVASSKADPLCNANDIAIWTGATVQIWSACNVGANTKYDPVTNGWSGTAIDAASEANRIAAYSGVINSSNNFLGGFYQWGRNDPVNLLQTGSAQYANGYQAWGVTLSSGSGFILGVVSVYSWVTDASHNTSSGTLWTNSTVSGPCPTGYHVPTGGTADTTTEWGAAFTIAGSGQTAYALGSCTQSSGYDRLRCALALPLVGARTSTTGVFGNQGTYGHYWSSSPNLPNPLAYYAQFGNATGTIAKTNGRSGGLSLRCIKN